jgi:hypothetical protein
MKQCFLLLLILLPMAGVCKKKHKCTPGGQRLDDIFTATPQYKQLMIFEKRDSEPVEYFFTNCIAGDDTVMYYLGNYSLRYTQLTPEYQFYISLKQCKIVHIDTIKHPYATD